MAPHLVKAGRANRDIRIRSFYHTRTHTRKYARAQIIMQNDFCIKMGSNDSHIFMFLYTFREGQTHKDIIHKSQRLKEKDSRSEERN